MNYYRIETQSHYTKTAYGEITESNVSRFGYSLRIMMD